MKRIFLFAFAFAALASNMAAQKASTVKVDPKKSVAAAFDRFVEGIRQVDAGKVADAYEVNPRLLVFNNNGSATIDSETVRTNTAATYAKLKNVSIDITGTRVEMLGERAAYLTCKWTQSQENAGRADRSLFISLDRDIPAFQSLQAQSVYGVWLASVSSKTIIDFVPPISVFRIFIGASQFT